MYPNDIADDLRRLYHFSFCWYGIRIKPNYLSKLTKRQYM